MINFGDVTRGVRLNPQRSKFPVSKDHEGTAPSSTIEVALAHLLPTYVKDELEPNPHCNILGFAVKVDQIPKDDSATFLPTDSKVQIVDHRINGAGEFQSNNPYNAFCFTEMCVGLSSQKRPMPSTELNYSGNWFTDLLAAQWPYLAISIGIPSCLKDFKMRTSKLSRCVMKWSVRLTTIFLSSNHQ